MLVIVTLEWPVAGDMPFTLNTSGQEPQVCILRREFITCGLNAGLGLGTAGSPGVVVTQPVPSVKAHGPDFRQAPPTTAP